MDKEPTISLLLPGAGTGTRFADRSRTETGLRVEQVRFDCAALGSGETRFAGGVPSLLEPRLSLRHRVSGTFGVAIS
jgi:hypothetical protein